MSNVIEIEVNGPRNERLAFAPLQRNLRGRFDVNRIAEPESRRLSNKIPAAIPGMRVSIDLQTGEGTIIDGIHEEPQTANRLRSLGYEIPPAREVFSNIDVPTWLFWVKRAVESGVAVVVRGELPAKINGEPQLHFYTPAPAKSSNDRLAAAIEAQTAVFAKLLDHLTSNK